MWTKRQLVEKAYSELALAGYVFDITPEEMQDALLSLDTLMASWDHLELGYQFGLDPTDTDPDDDSGLQLRDVKAVYLQLALDIASSKGKQVPALLMRDAKHHYDLLLSRAVRSRTVPRQTVGLPAGAGNRRLWRRINFLPGLEIDPDVAEPGDVQEE